MKTLQGNGYSTACFGTWHLTPDTMQGPGGPFDRCLAERAFGFDYFWGFLGGESGQFDPGIIENNKAIGVPEQEGILISRTPWRTRPSSGCTARGAHDASKPMGFMYFSTGSQPRASPSVS